MSNLRQEVYDVFSSSSFMLIEALRSIRDLGRLQEIAAVLIRYGFGELVNRLGISHALEKAGRTLHWKHEKSAEMSLPERARRALEEMGPTFIKLGQIISTRVDLLPQEWTNELAKLQYNVPPVDFESLRVEMEKDLGAAVEEVFAEFDTLPIAAASIAQVHHARLRDGTEVIVKIRRPGIQKLIDADLHLMGMMAKLLEFEFPELEIFRPTVIVRQFGISIRRELNLINESRNTERMRALFQEDPTIVIPNIYWDYVSERISVQDYIKGIASWDAQGVREAGLDRRMLAKVGADAVLRMILIEGFFHADPHDGNLLYLPGNRIAFIDFGMVGRMTQGRRKQLVDLLFAIAERDAIGSAEVLLDWAESEDTDYDQLSADMEELIDCYYGAPLKQLNLTSMLGDLAHIMRRHELALPPDLGLLFRALVAMDGMGRQNDPDFDIFSQTRPFVKQALEKHYSAKTLAMHSRRNFVQLFDIATEVPIELRRMLRSFRKGKLKINIDAARLDSFGLQVERAASWLTIGLVTAAIIVGSSIAMTVGGGPTLFGLPAFGLIGYSGAAVGAIWLLFSIWRIMRGHGSK